MDRLERLRALFGDRYRIIGEVGQGGMAVVYLADDLKLDRRVAIKVLRTEVASAVSQERFSQEIKIAARLEHERIVPLYDSGSHEETLYYVMRYIDGESLRDRLDREGHLEIEEALRLARDVAEALEFAHAQGIVHRDIKPANILLSGGHAVVADFGVARAISQATGELRRLTATGHVIGTPAYMSPEQASGEVDIDGRSDIYALSCVLYEMITGRPPFTGPSARAVLAGHVLEAPTPIHELTPSVPKPLGAVVERGLAKSPADRFESAAAFGAALEPPALPQYRPLLRQITRARPALGALVTIAAAIAIGTLWAVMTGSVDWDNSRVVVFPPMDPENPASFSAAGLDVAVAIEVAFDHMDPLAWHDGWSRLDGSVRTDPVLYTADIAREIARARGAAYYVDGLLESTPESLVVLLRLNDVREDTIVERSVARGARDSTTFSALALDAVLGLLPRLIDPTREFTLPALTGRDPDAIAFWIQAEREYRLSRFGAALEAYEQAVGEDSMLAYAAIKGALAGLWQREDAKAQALIAAAMSHDTLLPGRYAHLGRGLRAFIRGSADSAVASYQEALANDSTWTEAEAALAEVYYHLLPSEAEPAEKAKVHFERAIALDTSFTPPLIHLTEIAVREGDLERAARHIERLAEVGADSLRLKRLRFMADCMRDGPESIEWRELTANYPATVLMGAKEMSVAAANIACAERGYRSILANTEVDGGSKWGAVLGLQSLLVASGRVEEAIAFLDSARASGVTAVRYLYPLDLVAELPFEERASETRSYADERFGEDYERTGPLTNWVMAVYHAHYFHADRVEAISRNLKAKLEDGGREVALLLKAVAGHLELARHDTTAAIDSFAALSPTAPQSGLTWQLAEPLAVEKIILAELLLKRGEYQQAHDVATHFDHPEPIIYRPYLARSLLIRLKAAEALSQRRLAAKYRERILALGRPELVNSNLKR